MTEPILPGFESAVVEADAAKEQQTVAMMNQALREPLGNINTVAGKIEREAPLFIGTGENPTLF